MSQQGKYKYEVYDPSGNLLLDISKLVRSRSLTQTRNGASQIRFNLDLDSIESYCREAGTTAANVFRAGRNEIRITRGLVLLDGGRIRTAPVSLRTKTLQIYATGFLDDFINRYTGIWDSGTVQESFTGMSRGEMCWELISQDQARANGDFGITQGPTQYWVGSYDKEYDRTKIRNALIAATEAQAGAVDIEFTGDKKFNTYRQIGSVRNDIVFELGNALKDLQIPNDATQIANEVLGLARGLADDSQVTLTGSDSDSQLNNFLHQAVVLSDATTNDDGGLTNDVAKYLDLNKSIYDLPRLIFDGNYPPFVTDYTIGDYVNISAGGNYSMFANVNRMQRIEKRTIDIDDDDNEVVSVEVAV